MDILGVQIVSVAFSIFMIFFTYLSYKRRYFGFYALTLWLAVFGLLIFATLFPGFLGPFLKVLKIARLFDLFIIIGIFFLIVLSFLNFIHTQQLETKIEKLVQKKALNKK